MSAGQPPPSGRHNMGALNPHVHVPGLPSNGSLHVHPTPSSTLPAAPLMSPAAPWPAHHLHPYGHPQAPGPYLHGISGPQVHYPHSLPTPTYQPAGCYLPTVPGGQLNSGSLAPVPLVIQHPQMGTVGAAQGRPGAHPLPPLPGYYTSAQLVQMGVVPPVVSDAVKPTPPPGPTPQHTWPAYTNYMHPIPATPGMVPPAVAPAFSPQMAARTETATARPLDHSYSWGPSSIAIPVDAQISTTAGAPGHDVAPEPHQPQSVCLPPAPLTAPRATDGEAQSILLIIHLRLRTETPPPASLQVIPILPLRSPHFLFRLAVPFPGDAKALTNPAGSFLMNVLARAFAEHPAEVRSRVLEREIWTVGFRAWGEESVRAWVVRVKGGCAQQEQAAERVVLRATSVEGWRGVVERVWKEYRDRFGSGEGEGEKGMGEGKGKGSGGWSCPAG
ncbi:hypothetical protein BDZ91DRAFT_768272 [Kalaharituber pfeilii]|nr:hypothetical protein BDZ91DRAFT_768272 [Kalaharituber pfeilii]